VLDVKYICLDTNIYVYCALMTQLDHDPSYLEKLLDLISDKNIKLLVPEIIKAEYNYKVKQIHENIKEQLGQLQKHIKVEASLMSIQDKEALISFIEELSAKRKKAKDDSDDIFKRIISSDNCLEIPLTPEILTRSLLRTVSHRKPYDPNKYPKHLNYLGDVDCIIVESLRHVFSSIDSEAELYLCSNDDHFYDKDSLHQDIEEDINIEVYAFKTMPELLQAFNKPQREQDIKVYEEFSASLHNQMYASINPIMQAANQISREIAKNAGVLSSINYQIYESLKPFNELTQSFARDIKIADFLQNVPRVYLNFPQIDDGEEENKTEQKEDE